jgi:hypothetical protein
MKGGECWHIIFWRDVKANIIPFLEPAHSNANAVAVRIRSESIHMSLQVTSKRRIHGGCLRTEMPVGERRASQWHGQAVLWVRGLWILPVLRGHFEYFPFTGATTLCGSWRPPWFRNSKFFLDGVVRLTYNPQPGGSGTTPLLAVTLRPVRLGWFYQERTLPPA